MTLFAVPYALFPAMAGYGLGVLDSPGLFFYLVVTIITSTSTSVVAVFENRYFVLFGEHTWWKYVRKFFIAGSYIMVPLYFLPAQFLISEQESARIIVWESLGCQPEIPAHRELFVLSTDQIVPGYSIVVAEGVPSVEVATFAFLNLYCLLFKKTSPTLSVRTMKMQKKLVVALAIQVKE
uniref:Serpentine receptor class gamma n=1 Tax=Caenorhabditis tropicalis TaxID=1561998 RepID=A0A1I7TXS7_9PELO